MVTPRESTSTRRDDGFREARTITKIRMQTIDMATEIVANSGSFRDPVNRVYQVADSETGTIRILRGITRATLDNYISLSDQAFYHALQSRGDVIKTTVVDAEDPGAIQIIDQGWNAVLEHQLVPFVSYPYEWSFSMLKDAALLHLRILEISFENGWTLKDASPYNIQFLGSQPVFIDIPSFEPWIMGEPWVGYRQFCSMFLTPLLLRSHMDVDHIPILRSNLEGLPPTEAVKYFRGMARFRRGVLSHVVLPASVENSIATKERDNAPAKIRRVGKHSVAMVIGLVQSLIRLIDSLKPKNCRSDWSEYETTHSYLDSDFEEKIRFVELHAGRKRRSLVWDIGCNTGTFSRVCSPLCSTVVSLDADHSAIEKLYLNERSEKESNILPMVMNVANMSPGNGWAGKERLAFDQRAKPDLVLCLALIHHIRISANIPGPLFLEWLRGLGADVVIEFVTRQDEMVIKLLSNKREQYLDYDLPQFIEQCECLFHIADRKPLKGGRREIFFLRPK